MTNSYNEIFHSFKSGQLQPFYSIMYPGLLRYTVRLLGDELGYIAEDCLQDVVLASYLNRKKIPNEYAWRGWLLRSISNRVIEISRRISTGQVYAASVNMESLEEAPSMEADMIEQETMTAFFNAIASLPEKYREIVELSFRQGLKNEEVAQLLGLSEVAVRKRKRKLIEILRIKLGYGNDADVLLLLLIYYVPLGSN